jgi:16S rRNA processing protein RimM
MVVMGRVTAPFGVKGWVRIYPLSAQVTSLLEYPVWWLGRDGKWQETAVVAARAHGGSLVAQIAGAEDRDAAAALKGTEIAVPRAQLPATAADEYYWADMIGLRVLNAEGYEFGRVARIVQTGANDVLAVRGEGADKRETLIPFIAGAIEQVDLASGVIRVDWGKDY